MKISIVMHKYHYSHEIPQQLRYLKEMTIDGHF